MISPTDRHPPFYPRRRPPVRSKDASPRTFSSNFPFSPFPLMILFSTSGGVVEAGPRGRALTKALVSFNPHVHRRT